MFSRKTKMMTGMGSLARRLSLPFALALCSCHDSGCHSFCSAERQHLGGLAVAGCAPNDGPLVILHLSQTAMPSCDESPTELARAAQMTIRIAPGAGRFEVEEAPVGTNPNHRVPSAAWCVGATCAPVRGADIDVQRFDQHTVGGTLDGRDTANNELHLTFSATRCPQKERSGRCG